MCLDFSPEMQEVWVRDVASAGTARLPVKTLYGDVEREPISYENEQVYVCSKIALATCLGPSMTLRTKC
jgi:hypothetical protein